jgi:hypothetical protein
MHRAGRKEIQEKWFAEFARPSACFDRMADAREIEKSTSTRRKYVWPWFLLAAFIAAIILAVIWLSFEIERTRRVRDLSAPGGMRANPGTK